MKKSLILLIGAFLTLASCSKDGENIEKVQKIDAVFEISTLATKAIVDGDGVGTKVNRFVMEVWHTGSATPVLYTRQVKTGSDVTPGTDYDNPAKTKFTVTLVKGQPYDVLFWADCSNSAGDLYYDTTSLYEVKVINTATAPYVANNDKRDAFSKYLSVPATADATFFNQTIQLVRPFGQLNLITKDIDEIEANTGTVKVVPDKIKVTYSAASQFNVKTQTGSELKTFSYEAAPYYLDHKTVAAAEDLYTLSMDYVIAPSAEQMISTISLAAYKGSSLLNSQDFSNVPLQRNYRTNIIGNLLTITGDFVVETSPVWNTPEKDVNL